MPRARARLTDDLARRYLVRVIAHAKRLARRLPPHIALNDLISAGLLGVVEGFLRFDPDRAETLDAYLDHRIRGALLDELRRADPLTRAQRGFTRHLGRASRAASNEPGGVNDESLAKALGLSLAELRTRVSQVNVAMAIHGTGCADRVEDEALTPDAEVSARQEHRLLSAATGSLPAREREVLRLYYEEGQTFREIGGSLGVSESRVSQLHTRAIQNLRAILAT
jgi:RNA polymerase sigma factor for flagellar operon FliA